MKFYVHGAVSLLTVTLLALSTSQANVVTVSLAVDPSSVLSSNWTTGDLVEVVVQATSNGEPNQGFAGADLGSGSFGITVDGNDLRVRDVKFSGTMQVDTESLATSLNGMGGYVKADDMWVFDNFTDFVKPDPNDSRDIILTDTRIRAIPSAVIGQLNLGRGAPVDFLHIVLEVQAGLVPNSSAYVTFYGQMGAFGAAQEDIRSNLFGTINGDVNTGSFAVTNLPEPASVALLLAGSLLWSVRRRLKSRKS